MWIMKKDFLMVANSAFFFLASGLASALTTRSKSLNKINLRVWSDWLPSAPVEEVEEERPS